ncbi:MAG: hypothetical protein V4597_21705 [Pseudomonadota bacterium]
MRSFGIGLAAALFVAVMAPAAVVMAAKKPVEEITPASRTQGMAEAPAVAAAAGIACTVTDARFVGKMSDKKAKTETNYYEIDCDKGLGFILSAVTGAKPTAFTCVEANSPTPEGKPSSLPCKLPGNADPKSDLAGYIAKAGIACTPDQVRGIGQSATSTFLEISCTSGDGYVLQTSAPADEAKKVEANNCLLYDDSSSNIKCTLHDKAYRMAIVDTLVTASKNGCAVKDRRYAGMSQAGAMFYETSCADGKGYLYKVEKGQLVQTYPCEKASMVMGGCELTDAKEAETAQAGLYTKLAKTAAFDCEVSKYAPFPSPAGLDVVEMACSNRPDGGVGVFGGPGVKPQVYDCARAPVAGYRCSFTKPDLAFPLVTADLRKMGKNECTVSATRYIGKTTKGTGYLEVGCSDGLKGYILEYAPSPLAPVGVIGCAFSKDCKLPGNT